MIWWIWPIIVGGAGVVYDLLKESPPPPKRGTRPRPEKPKIVVDEKAVPAGDMILVLGRTGAGKSSLINMLKKRKQLETGAVASTTRWLEGVQVEIAGQRPVFVDTPGIGEAVTAQAYHDGIVGWFSANKSSVRALLLVLQADSKAHSEDKELLDRLSPVGNGLPILVALNQVDKLAPVRTSFRGRLWSAECRRASQQKVRNVERKINEVSRQFGIAPRNIIPVVSKWRGTFNRIGMIDALAELVVAPGEVD